MEITSVEKYWSPYVVVHHVFRNEKKSCNKRQIDKVGNHSSTNLSLMLISR